MKESLEPCNSALQKETKRYLLKLKELGLGSLELSEIRIILKNYSGCKNHLFQESDKFKKESNEIYIPQSMLSRLGYKRMPSRRII